MQTSIGAMFRATFNTSETLPLGDDGPDRSRSDRGFKRRRQASRFRTVAKRYHGFARHFATEGDHTIRGRDDGVLRPCTQIQTAMPRQPLFSRRSYSPITCACFKGHCIDVRHAACATSCATSSADCAYADAVGCAQHIVNAIFANTHTAIAAAHRCRLRLSMSSDILLCRTRRRYSHLFMRPPVVRVSIGKSISWHVRRPPVDLERPCGRRTTLIHRCRACRAMTCQNATERGIRWDA